jgi:cell wall-associated NlpC family hydrolase
MSKVFYSLLIGFWLVTFTSTLFAFGIVYTVGDKGPEVSLIQTKLQERGYYRGPIDGVFNYKMEAAVKAFQRSKKLPADGIVDNDTYCQLVGKKVASPVANQKIQALLNTAQKYLGTPYVFGGTTPQGFDCSGYIQYVFKQQGHQLPRLADQQYLSGKVVAYNNLKPGDLLFFTTYAKGASHNGIYLGAGKFIHASSSHGVMISKLAETYWQAHYLGARRVMYR